MRWVESTRTTHTSLREAVSTALDRTVHVDEDTGSEPAVAVPRVQRPAWGQGVHTSLVAESLALAQLPTRRSARAWELTAHHSLDSRRHGGFLRQRWDLIEELWPGVAPGAVLHIAGPWSLGVSVEYRGHPVFGDRPAFKDMALALGEAIAEEAGRLSAILSHTGHSDAGRSEVRHAPVHIVIHEPRVSEVLTGVAGVTQFDSYPPVDPAIVWGVWRRLADQLAGTASTFSIDFSINAINTDGAKVLLDMLTDTSSDDAPLPVIPVIPAGLAKSQSQDLVAALFDRGQQVTWELSELAVAGGTGSLIDIERSAAVAAKEILAGWRRWMLPADSLPELISTSMPEGVRSPSEAATAAAVTRMTAGLLWRN